jgi:hypothetical protein
MVSSEGCLLYKMSETTKISMSYAWTWPPSNSEAETTALKYSAITPLKLTQVEVNYHF